jgi:hypothetical protein
MLTIYFKSQQDRKRKDYVDNANKEFEHT